MNGTRLKEIFTWLYYLFCFCNLNLCFDSIDLCPLSFVNNQKLNSICFVANLRKSVKKQIPLSLSLSTVSKRKTSKNLFFIKRKERKIVAMKGVWIVYVELNSIDQSIDRSIQLIESYPFTFCSKFQYQLACLDRLDACAVTFFSLTFFLFTQNDLIHLKDIFSKKISRYQEITLHINEQLLFVSSFYACSWHFWLSITLFNQILLFVNNKSYIANATFTFHLPWPCSFFIFSFKLLFLLVYFCPQIQILSFCFSLFLFFLFFFNINLTVFNLN